MSYVPGQTVTVWREQMPIRCHCVVIAVMLFCETGGAQGKSLGEGIKLAEGERVGTITTDLIYEASGVVASRKNPGVLWVHNDSGDAPRVYAINKQGMLLDVYEVPGARAEDWEDIALGPGPEQGKDHLYIGDIGDNRAVRESVTVYRVVEPRVEIGRGGPRPKTQVAEPIELVYPDGPRDAETLLIDPVMRDLYVISKREERSKVYLAAYPQQTNAKTTMKHVATMPWGWAVGGDVSRDGALVVVRTPLYAGVWKRQKGMKLAEVFDGKEYRLGILPELQGEGMCFDVQGRGCLSVSESVGSPIFYYNITDLLGGDDSEAMPSKLQGDQR